MPESSHPGAFFVLAQIPAAAVVGADALIGPYKFYRTFPTSIRRKSRARLWSIEGGRGNHLKGFPGLFFLLPGVFFLEKQKKMPSVSPFLEKANKEKNVDTKPARNF